MGDGTIYQRFWKKVRMEDDCWIWTAATTGKNNYGRIKYEGRYQLAHRVAWMLFVGPIMEDEVDHLCQQTLCVNPDHLQPVPHKENQRRRAERRTHCKYGHKYPPLQGSRNHCKICKARINREHNARRQQS